MADELSEEQVAQFRVAFKTFDKDDSGVITEDQLGDVMRSLGQAMTKLQVRTMVQEVDEDGNGQIEFEEFLTMMARKMDSGDTEDDLIEAFRVFDYEQTGYVSACELLMLVTTMGDKMTLAEAEELIRVSAAEDDKIDYLEFSKKLTKKNKN